MKKLLLLLLISIPLLLSAQEKNTEKDLLRAMHSISSHDLLEYVKIQCDDRFAGRLTGTEEFKECAKWLASFFNENGLKPAGDNGSWYQWFEIPYTLIYPDCGVALHMHSGRKETVLKHYKYVSEFMPGSTSGNGEVTAEVVYAGYGITAPELGYDDYKGIDLKAK